MKLKIIDGKITSLAHTLNNVISLELEDKKESLEFYLVKDSLLEFILKEINEKRNLEFDKNKKTGLSEYHLKKIVDESSIMNILELLEPLSFSNFKNIFFINSNNIYGFEPIALYNIEHKVISKSNKENEFIEEVTFLTNTSFNFI